MIIGGYPRPSALLRFGVGLSRAPLRCGAVLRTAPAGRSLPILSAFPRFRGSLARPCFTLWPTSFRSLRQRCAPFIAPGVTLHSACYGSGCCIRPASATINPPHGPLPVGQPAAHRQPSAQPPGRAGPKRPHATLQPLLNSVAGHRPKKACHLPVKLAFRPRRQKQGPLRGGSIGEHPKPPPSCPG